MCDWGYCRTGDDDKARAIALGSPRGDKNNRSAQYSTPVYKCGVLCRATDVQGTSLPMMGPITFSTQPASQPKTRNVMAAPQ